VNFIKQVNSGLVVVVYRVLRFDPQTEFQKGVKMEETKWRTRSFRCIQTFLDSTASTGPTSESWELLFDSRRSKISATVQNTMLLNTDFG